MLGSSLFRWLKRYMPWNNGIPVKAIAAQGNTLFFVNLSDMAMGRPLVRRYSLFVDLEETRSKNKHNKNYMSRSAIKVLVGKKGYLNFGGNYLSIPVSAEYSQYVYGVVSEDFPRMA